MEQFEKGKQSRLLMSDAMKFSMNNSLAVREEQSSALSENVN